MKPNDGFRVYFHENELSSRKGEKKYELGISIPGNIHHKVFLPSMTLEELSILKKEIRIYVRSRKFDEKNKKSLGQKG